MMLANTTQQMVSQNGLSAVFVIGAKRMYSDASSRFGLKLSCTMGYYTKLCPTGFIGFLGYSAWKQVEVCTLGVNCARYLSTHIHSRR